MRSPKKNKIKNIFRIFAKRKNILSLFVFSSILFSVFSFIEYTSAATGINKQISFQGKVVNSNGTNVPDGDYDFVFILYTQQAPGGSAVWTETRTGGNQVTVTDGIFQVNLGSVTALPGSIDFNTDNIYLGIEFNGDGEMDPRVRFTAAPYAFNALKVAGLTVTDTTGTLTIPNSETISFGGSFTTSASNDVTLTTSGATTVTLPTSGTLATLAGVEIFTNKTIGSTGLVFSGATTDITTATDEALTITAAGTGDIVFSLDSNTFVSLTGTTDGQAALTVAAGDVTLTDGDLIVSAGDVNFTLDAADTLNITKTGANAGDVANITASSVNAIDGLQLAITSTADSGADANVGLDIAWTESTDADTWTAINLPNTTTTNSTTSGLVIGTGYDTGISVASGGVSIAAGALAVNSDSITSDGTLVINASGTTDVQDTLNADAITSDAGVSIAAGNSYTGAGAVTLSSASGTALTVDSGTTGAVNLATGNNIKTISLGTGTAGNTINIGTNNTTKDTITIGSALDDVAIASDSWGITNAGALTVVSCSGCGGSFTVRESDGSPSVSSTTTLEFGPASTSSEEFIVTDQTGGVTRVIAGTMIGKLNEAETVTAGWTFNTAATTFTTAINANGGLTTTTADQNLAFSANGAGDFVFSVDSGTIVSLTGGADGTSALTVAAGDVTLTDGDLIVSGGDANFTLDAADSVNITKGAASGAGGALVIANTTAASDTSGAEGQDVSLTVTQYADDNAADTYVGLDVLVINNATDAGTDDIVYGIRLQDLGGTTGQSNNEYGFYQAGTGWDYGIYAEDLVGIDNDLQFVGAQSITTTTGNLTINAGGTVDVQDTLNADAITSDAGVSIAAGNSYTGAGAVTLSSGGTSALTLDATNGNVTLNTDDDLIPTLGAGDADLGASGTRWDNIFGAVGNFTSLTVNGTADPFVDETGDTMTGALVIDPTTTGTFLDFVLETQWTAGDLINADWGSGVTQTAALTGLNLDFTNLTSVAGSTTYGLLINDLAAQTSSTEYALYQEGTNWDYGIYAEDLVGIDNDLQFVGAQSITTTTGNLTINAGGTVDVQDTLNADAITSDAGVSIAAGNSYTGAGAVTVSSANTTTLTVDSGTTGALNLGTGNDIKTISLGTGTAGNTINIGTNNTTKDTITIGSALDDVAIASDSWGVTNAGALTVVSIGAFTAAGTIDMNTNILTNIGNSGTDFVASTGALTLAGVLTANGGITMASSQTFTASSLSYMDLGAITHGTTAVQGLRLPQAASASPSSPSSGEGYLAWDAAGDQLIYYTGSAWSPVTGGSGYATIQDEGSGLTQRTILNFTGAGVSCVDNGGSTRTDCTISGGGSNDLQTTYGLDADGSDTTISLTTADDSLIFTNPTSSGTDSAFLLSLNQAHTTGAVSALDIVQASSGSNAVNLTANSIDTETGLSVSATGLTTGYAMDINVNGATSLTTGGAINIDGPTGAANLSSGTGLLSIITTGAITGSSGQGTHLQIWGTGGTTNNLASIRNASVMTTTGSLLNLTASAATTTTGLLTVTASGLTTGYAIDINANGGNTLTTGGAINIDGPTSTASQSAGSLLMITTTGATTGTDGSGNSLQISSATVTGTIASISDVATMTTTGDLLTLTANNATTPTGLLTMNATGLTSGYAQHVNVAGTTTMTTGGAINVDGPTGAATMNATTGLVNISSTGAITNSTTGAGSGTLLQVTGNGIITATLASISDTSVMTTTGKLLDLTANAATTTTGLLTMNADGLTSGRAFNLSSSSTAFTGSLQEITLSGSSASNTGNLLKISNTGTSNANTSFYIDHRATGSGNLALRVDDVSGDTSPFVIDGTGNVGIGTSSPAVMLHLLGTSNALRIGYDTSNYTTLSTDSAGTLSLASSNTSEAAVVIGTGSAQDTSVQYDGSSNDYFAGVDDTTGSFFIGSGTTVQASSATLAITSTGLVGVGDSTPDGKLDFDLTSTSTTGATEYGGNFTVSDTGIVTTGTDTTYGTSTTVTRTGATGGTINTYGNYTVLTSDNAGSGTSTAYGSYIDTGTAAATNADTVYGLYINSEANAGTAYGLYVDVGAQAGTEYAGVFLNGNVGVGTAAPSTFMLQVAGSIGPNANDTYDLGSDALRFANLYLGGETLHIGTSTSDEALLSYTTASNTLLLDNTATGIINIGTTALAQTITLGNTTTSTTVNINSGTGGINLQAAGTGTIDVIQIGAGGGGNSTPDLFGLDVKSDTGDPAGGFEGAMYYNTSDNVFRCYQNSGWTNCIGGGGSGISTVRESDASPSVGSLTTLEFGPASTSSEEFIVTDQTGGVARVVAGTMIGKLNEAETVTAGWTFNTAATTFTTAINANGGITFDASTDTVGAFTAAGTIDMNTNILTNIGNSGTDFVASTGALTLAGVLTANGGITMASSQTFTASSLSYMDLGAITHGTTAVQGLRLPQAASASPSSPSSGEGYLAWDAGGNQIIVYNGSSWGTVGGGSGYSTIEEEGTPVTQRSTLNFIGGAITCVDNASKTECTIAGAGGESLQDTYGLDADGSNATISLTAADDGLVFTNPTSGGNNLSAFVLQISQQHTTDAIAILDLIQSSNAANGVNLTANAIDGESGLSITTNGLTSGKGLQLTSSATAFTGNLADISLTGSNASNTGNVLAVSNTGTNNANTALFVDHRATGTGNLALRVNDESSDTTPFIIDGNGRVGIGTAAISETASTERLLQVGSETNRGNSVTYGEVVTKGLEDSTALTGIKDVYVYDTTADSDGGRWIDWATTDNLSWYTETLDDGPSDPCDIASDDRCYAAAFPRKAILIVTTSALYIFDAATNDMWMKFSQNASGYALGVDTSNDPSSVTALNGVIYVGTNGASATGLYAIDFVNDRMWNYDDTDRSGADVGISGRNAAVTYNSDNQTALDLGGNTGWKTINDVSAASIQWSNTAIAATTGPVNGTSFVALATDSGVNLINLAQQRLLQYSRITDDNYESVVITKSARLYALDSNRDELNLWINVDSDVANQLNAAADKAWDESTNPALTKTTPVIATGAPDALEVIERGSLADGGLTAGTASDLIYIGHDQGMTELHDHATLASGWVKYYSTTRQTAMLPARTIRAHMMDDASGDVTNQSVGTDVMVPKNAPTYGANGVRGKAMSFNGTDEYLCSGAGGVCANDASDNLSTGSWTISAWFKHATNIAGTDVLFARCYNTTPAAAAGCVAISMPSTGVMTVNVDFDATFTIGVTGTTVFHSSSQTYNDNQWHFIMVTRAATTGNINTMIDGKPIGQTAGVNTTLDASQIIGIGTDCSSGAACATGGNFWEGSIDDFVYNANGGTGTTDNIAVAAMRRIYNDARPTLGKKTITVTDATAATSTTLQETGSGWIPNEFAGLIMEVTGSTDSDCIGVTRRVTSNTSDTLTFNPAAPGTCTLDTSADFEVDPESINGASNSVYAIGITAEAPLGEARQMCVGTNSGTDTGGVTCFNHQAGPNIVADIFHSQAGQEDNSATSWSGGDYDDIRSIDLSGRALVMGSEAHFWTETQDVRLGQGLDYLNNQLFSIRQEIINDAITAQGSIGAEVGFTGGADLAERYYSNETLGAGEVVEIDSSLTAGVKRTARAYERNAIGVVATAPGIILGEEAENSYPVALVGRVPVKVTNENGPIYAGDRVTSATRSGHAMLATQSGRVIGQALGDAVDWAVCEGEDPLDRAALLCTTVMVFVNLADYSGMPVELAMAADAKASGLDETGDATESGLAGEDGTVRLATAEPTREEKIMTFLRKVRDERLASNRASSEVFTDRVSASTEIITPRLVVDELLAKSIKAESIEGLEIFTDSIKSLQEKYAGLQPTTAGTNNNSSQLLASTMKNLATDSITVQLDGSILGKLSVAGALRVGGEAQFDGDTIFGKLATFLGDTLFQGKVNFAKAPTFGSDTAGFAIIEEGAKRVRITFDENYEEQPIVAVSLTNDRSPLLDEQADDTLKADVALVEADFIEGVFDDNLQYIVTEKGRDGFTIVLSKVAPRDLQFSWVAVAVKDGKTFTSEKVETPPVEETPILEEPISDPINGETPTVPSTAGATDGSEIPTENIVTPLTLSPEGSL